MKAALADPPVKEEGVKAVAEATMQAETIAKIFMVDGWLVLRKKN